jgi:hypothetical protein
MSVFMLGLAGLGFGGGVLVLDHHPFFARHRLSRLVATLLHLARPTS